MAETENTWQPSRNPNDRAALAVSALDEVWNIGLDAKKWSWDRDQAEEYFAKRFGQLFTALLDTPIETYPHLPFGEVEVPFSEGRTKQVTLQDVFTHIHPKAQPFSLPPGDLASRLWAGEDGYTVEDTTRLTMPGELPDPTAEIVHARAALRTGDNPREPLLHWFNMPHDKCSPGYRPGMPTQVEELARRAEEFQSSHPRALLRALGVGGVAMLAIQRRIEGAETRVRLPMPMEWGYALLPTLGRRKEMDLYVYSEGEPLNIQYGAEVRWREGVPRLSHAPGEANSRGGIPLSVELKSS